MCPMIFPHMFPIFSQKNLGFSSQLCEITRPRVSRDVVFRRPGAECEGPTSQRPATVKGRVFFWVKSSTKDGGHNRMHMFASSSRHCYLPSISTCTTRLAVVDRSVRTKMKGTILCNICIMCMYIYIAHILYIHIYVHIYGLHFYMCTKIDILRTCSFISSRDLRFGAVRQLEAPTEPSRAHINNNDDNSNNNIVHNIYICICVYIIYIIFFLITWIDHIKIYTHIHIQSYLHILHVSIYIYDMT